ncbi:MAG: hypothetical protein H6735_18000 [Alphaproteobacteria bacterium]|nr:hypothetical protein [Alphaproteobacteria bacterium]
MIAWMSYAFASVTLDAAPVQGTEVVIEVRDDLGDPDSGETVRVVHRPGLAGTRELAIGITDGRGRVRWTPAEGGVARVRAGDQVLDLRIEPEHRPDLTLSVLVALSLLGLGLLGFAVGYRAR